MKVDTLDIILMYNGNLLKFLDPIRLRTEVLRSPSSTRPRFELMTSRS